MHAPKLSRKAVYEPSSPKNRTFPQVRLLSFIGVAVAFIVAFTSVSLLLQSRSRAIAETLRELETGTLVLSEDTDRAFQALDMIQSGLIKQISGRGIETPEGFEQRMSDADTYQTLHDEIAALPYLDAISVIDSRGNLINSSRSWPLVKKLNLSNHPFFRALGMDTSPATFLEPPILNRTTNTWAISFAHKILAPNGQLLGFVNGVFQLSYFEHFYQSISFGKDSTITLLRNDGVLLFRYPRTDQRIGVSLSNSPMYRSALDATGPSEGRFVSQLDGSDRLFVSRALANHPILLTISIPIASALEDWRTQAEQIAVVVALLSLTIAGAILLGIRHLKSQSLLTTANTARSVAEAELRVAQRTDAKIRHMAHYDALTDLPNRVLFHEKLEAALGYARRGHLVALHFLDLDRFKAVNDTLGHPIGDRLLRAVAQRLRSGLRETDSVARLGGDEFAIVQTAIESPSVAAGFAERMIATLSKPFEIDGNLIVIGASIGVAFAPQNGLNAEQFVICADLALYRAKADGRGMFRLYDSDMDAKMRATFAEGLSVRQELHKA